MKSPKPGIFESVWGFIEACFVIAVICGFVGLVLYQMIR